MNYIAHRRFKGVSISGNVNLPAMTDCGEAGNVIYYNGNAICVSTSHIAHQYFLAEITQAFADGVGVIWCFCNVFVRSCANLYGLTTSK